MILRITASDIEYSGRGAVLRRTPVENAVSTRWPGTSITCGDGWVRVSSKIHGQRQWAYSDALQQFMADWETCKPVKPGWFRLREIDRGA